MKSQGRVRSTYLLEWVDGRASFGVQYLLGAIEDNGSLSSGRGA